MIKLLKKLTLAFVLLLCANGLSAQTLAFPTAEGFGKFSKGGRGGQVVTVTTLEDDSIGNIQGSLRWALAQYPNEPLTVVFGVSGRIELKQELRVKRDGLTLAGQTAPGDGICISGNKVNLGGSKNFIIRHLRFRTGQFDAAGNVVAQNALGAENCENFIIDHCTFGWSVEENINTFDDKFHTVQWCIIHEGLYNAGHSKGARGYGMQWGGSQATYHHNLLANNSSRSCRFNGARNTDLIVFIEYINNVNFNWGRSNSVYGGENTGNKKYSVHECNMLNNYYKPGPALGTGKQYFVCPSYAREDAVSRGPSKWHLSGNVMEGNPEVTANNWQGVRSEDSGYTMEEIKVDTIIIPIERHPSYPFDYKTYSYLNYESAEDAYQSVLTSAGAFPRDAVDERIIDEVTAGVCNYGNNGILDTPGQAGGYPEYKTEGGITDADNDGMDDEWELANHLDPTNPDDRNWVNEEGYTALEAYLNGLVGEETSLNFAANGIQSHDVKELLVQVWVDGDRLNLSSSEPVKKVSIYNLIGVKVLVDNNVNSAIDIASLAPGNYILVANEGTDRIVKTVKFIKK